MVVAARVSDDERPGIAAMHREARQRPRSKLGIGKWRRTRTSVPMESRARDDAQAQLLEERHRVQLEPLLADLPVGHPVDLETGEADLPVVAGRLAGGARACR